jgi:hypothetical protein
LDADHIQTKELVAAHEEKEELMAEISKLKDQNYYLCLKIDILKCEKKVVEAKNLEKIQCLCKEIMELTNITDSHSEVA